MAAEIRLVLHDISWETYQCLLADSLDNCAIRMTYGDGTLEIMVVYVGHETPNRILASIAEIIAEETGLDFCPTGSTTFQRSDLLKGFEPDSSFYFQNAAAIRGKSELDLQTDPPPELVLDVDITRSSLRRFPIFAAIGVAEIWRYDGERVKFHSLSGGEYHEMEQSIVLPPMTASQASIFLKKNAEQTAPVWLRSVREWVRSQA
jgi:Uma2 family endonuclease